MGNEPSTPRNLASSSVDNSLASPASPNDSASEQPVSEKRSSSGKRNGAKTNKDEGRRSRVPKEEDGNRRNRNSSSRRGIDDEESTAAILIDQMCVQGFSFFGSELKNGRKTRAFGSFASDDPSYDDDRQADSYDDDDDTYEDDAYDDDYRGGKRRGKKLDTVSESSSFVSNSMTDDYADSTASGQRGTARVQRRGRNRDEEDSTTVEGESEEDSHRHDDRKAKVAAANARTDMGGSSSVDGSSTALTSQTEEENAGGVAAPIGSGSKPGPSGLMTKPLASSFAKRCYFTKAGIGKSTQHYEGLTLTGNVVLMLASAMKLKGCPTICDEDLRRVEQTYPNQFSRLPDELLLSSGWRRISKYCHFSNKPIPDGVPFFHSKKRIHPQTGGYFFLLAAAVGMIRPSDVEALTMDTLIVLQTDFPNQCDSAPQELISEPQQWTLVDKFCFFSGGPINTEEDVYYRADFDGNQIYMLAFLSPALTPEELYRLNAEMEDIAGDGTTGGLKTIAAVQEVERVYDLTDRDFDDLKLYHLGPCRALPQYILQPAAWTKVLPPHFTEARQKALERAQEYEASHPQAPGQSMLPSPERKPQGDLGAVGFDGFHFGSHPSQFPMAQDHVHPTAEGAGWNVYGYNVEQSPAPAGAEVWQQQQLATHGPTQGDSIVMQRQEQQAGFGTANHFVPPHQDSFLEENPATQTSIPSGVPMQQIQTASPGHNQPLIDQHLQTLTDGAVARTSSAHIARPQSFDQSAINGQSAMEEQRMEQRLRGRSPGAAVFSFYDPNATVTATAPQQPFLQSTNPDETNVFDASDGALDSATGSPSTFTGEQDRQTTMAAVEEVGAVPASYFPVMTDAVTSGSVDDVGRDEQPLTSSTDGDAVEKEETHATEPVVSREDCNAEDEGVKDDQDNSPVDVARQLKREVEEEGAFVTTLEEQPIDEAIATRAKLKESTSPADTDARSDPPEEGEDELEEQHGGIDPPDDEPPSLSPKSGSLPPTPTTTSMHDAPEDEVEERESDGSVRLMEVIDSPTSVQPQESLQEDCSEAEDEVLPSPETQRPAERILEDESPEKSHWSDEYDDKEDDESDDMIIHEQLAPTITNEDAEYYDDENVPPHDHNNPAGKLHGVNDEVEDKLHDDDVDNVVENAIYEEFRQRRGDDDSTRGDGGDVSLKESESVYTREEEYYDDEFIRRGETETFYGERPEEEEDVTREIDYETDTFSQSQPRSSPHEDYDDYSEGPSFSSPGGGRSEPLSPRDDESQSLYSADRSEGRHRGLKSRVEPQELLPNSPSTVDDTDGRRRMELGGSPPETDGSPTDVTPSSAMRGAQALLRKNRQKRLAMAAHRRQITATLQSEGDTAVAKGVASPNLSNARQPKTPTRRSGESPKGDEQPWDSETEADTSMVSSPSSGWTENTGPADRSSRRALILQMAKARMKSTRAGISRNKRTASSPASSGLAVRSSQMPLTSQPQESLQSGVPKLNRINSDEILQEEDDEMQPPEQVGSSELDFTADLD